MGFRDDFHPQVACCAESLMDISSSSLYTLGGPQMFALQTFNAAMNDKATLSKLIDTKIELLKHLSHPNIVSFHELLDDGNGDGQQRVIMEYCAGGDLSIRWTKLGHQGELTCYDRFTILSEILLPTAKACNRLIYDDILLVRSRSSCTWS